MPPPGRADRGLTRTGVGAVAVGVAAVGVVVLAVVVAAASRRSAFALPDRSGPVRIPAPVGQALLVMAGVAAVGLTGLAVWALWGAEWSPPRRRRSLAAQLVVLLLMALAFRAFAGPLTGRLRGPGGANAPTDATGGQAARGAIPWGPLLALAVVVVALGAWAAVSGGRPRRSTSRSGTPADELVWALDDSVEDLRAEADPRRAIKACYARMQWALARSGLAREPSEAPREFLARVLRGLEVDAASVVRLTGLFEEAEFSVHPLDASSKDAAIAALLDVRDQLTVRPGTSALRTTR